MPPDDDGVIVLDHDSEDSDMASVADDANLSVAMTLMATAAAAAAARRTDSADQLSGDSQRMWAIAMTTPTVMAAQGIQMVKESGSGRTRAETNLPAATSAAGNA